MRFVLAMLFSVLANAVGQRYGWNYGIVVLAVAVIVSKIMD